MDFLTDWLTDWLKELLIGGIMGNLEGLFDYVNTQVGEIAVQVGTTPAAWNAGVFSPVSYTHLQSKEIQIVGMLSDCPFYSAAGVGTIICSEDTFEQITGESKYTVIDVDVYKRQACDKAF